jgi:Kdo2-lipid IVA lauroyltransferase/acyltransferase
MNRAIGHRAEYAFFRFVQGMVTVLPEPVATVLGAALGWSAGVVFRLRRAVVDEQLAWAFPRRDRSWRDRVARESYMHLGREAVAMLRMGRMTREQVLARTAIPDFDTVQAAFERGGGVILLTGHFGNWEIAGAAFAARGIPMDAIVKGMANERFSAEINRARERLGMHVIDMLSAPKEVLRSLRRGRATAIVADQNAHRSGIFVPFFGRLAATVRGPAVFALRTGAPMFLVWPLRDPGWGQTYTVSVHPIPYESTGDQEADVRRLTEAFTQVLEEGVRSAPGQYFWQHKRWKRRPPEETEATAAGE